MSSSNDLEADLSEIANSLEFHLLQKEIENSAQLIATGNIDVIGIVDKMRENNDDSFCDVDLSEYEGLTGIKEYFNTNCNMQRAGEKLRAAYPEYQGLPRESVEKIMDIYTMKHGKLSDRVHIKPREYEEN